MVHFRQIMVFVGQPKYGNAIHSSPTRLVRKLNRSQGFQNREQRPAKESDLLPSNKCAGSGPKTGNVGKSFRRSVPRFILPFQNRSYAFAARGIIPQFGCGLAKPLRKTCRPWVKLPRLGIARNKIGKQCSRVRNLAKWDALRFHRRLS